MELWRLVPFLPVRDDFHPKRNQARQKLATLPTSRFKDLSSDVYYELSRRYPEFKDDVRNLQSGNILILIITTGRLPTAIRNLLDLHTMITPLRTILRHRRTNLPRLPLFALVVLQKTDLQILTLQAVDQVKTSILPDAVMTFMEGWTRHQCRHQPVENRHRISMVPIDGRHLRIPRSPVGVRRKENTVDGRARA